MRLPYARAVCMNLHVAPPLYVCDVYNMHIKNILIYIDGRGYTFYENARARDAGEKWALLLSARRDSFVDDKKHVRSNVRDKREQFK